MVVLTLILAAFLVSAGVVFAACGGGDGDATATAEATTCEVGNPPLLKNHRRVPTFVEEEGLDSPPKIVGCLKDPLVGEAEIVGFRNFGPAVCLTIDAMKYREAHGELCTVYSEPATRRCQGKAGCITNYLHVHGFTEFSGPVDAKVKELKVTVKGRPVKRGFTIADISGKVAKSVYAPEPFGFFVAFIPGCIKAKDVKVSLFDANGSSMGVAGGWTAPAGPCTN